MTNSTQVKDVFFMAQIYVVTNRNQTGKRSLVSVLQEAVAAGVDAVILREKDLQPGQFYQLAGRIKSLCLGTATRLLINSSVEATLACDADGVHLSRDSLPLEVARRILPNKIIGVSVHSPEEAIAAQAGRADYVLAGHIFSTSSKPGQPGRGLDFIRELSSGISLPVIAIGGINSRNAGQVIRAGAAGVAVMSLVMGADDIRGTIHQLRRSLF